MVWLAPDENQESPPTQMFLAGVNPGIYGDEWEVSEVLVASAIALVGIAGAQVIRGKRRKKGATLACDIELHDLALLSEDLYDETQGDMHDKPKTETEFKRNHPSENCSSMRTSIDASQTERNEASVTTIYVEDAITPESQARQRTTAPQVEAQPIDSTTGSFRLHLARIWMAICFVAAGLIGTNSDWYGHSVAPDSSIRSVGSLTNEPVLRPIRDVAIGDRVLGTNPLGKDEFQSEVDNQEWRHIHLRLQKSNNEYVDIQLLRPESWIEEHQLEVKRQVTLDLQELGVSGVAELISIDACPEISSSNGQIVTGKFVHHSNDLVEIQVAGLEEPIRCTANHPFWSATKQEFVRADQLSKGEFLQGLDSQLAVLSVSESASRDQVMNLEVQFDHVYLVSHLGVLVHNNCGEPGFPAPKGAPLGAGHNAANAAKLTEHLRQAEKYGAAGFKELENGRFRYFGNVTPARTPGTMQGTRLVREWDPATGNSRTWLETLDQQGRVRIVRPETGGPKIHYQFDENGNFIGTF